ncbi:MAG TPA: hypothetical protein VG929_05205, partial [Actinomycetota bacterium]|nr:hypothetical protein [Actinomycetota bacterium]
MKRRILLAAATALAVVLGVTVYVVLGVVRDLRAARVALEGFPAAPAAADLPLAKNHVSNAVRRLDTVPARAVGLVPVIRQNLGSIRAVLEASLPLLEAAAGIDAALEPIRRGGLITDGTVDLVRLEALEGPVGRSEVTLENLNLVAGRALSPVLLPPVWDLVALVEDRSGRSLATTRAAQAALAAAPELLGRTTPRTYLVVLINNAELRGAGG